MWNLLIAPLADLAKQHFANKAEEKQAKHQATIKRIEGEQSWEQTMAEGSLTGFKDEWWTIVLSLPIVALVYAVAFDEPLVIQRINEAFEALEKLPEYYQYLLYVAVLASFGIRGADRIMGIKK